MMHADTSRDQEKKAFKAGAFPHGILIPTAEILGSSEYACLKLHKGDWVELWYFTQEGCLEAAKLTTSLANDTFGITTEDSSTAPPLEEPAETPEGL